MNWITITTYLPLAGALLLLLYGMTGGKEQERLNNGYRNITLLTTLLTFAVSIPILLGFDRGNALPQMVTKIPWIGTFGVSYHTGVDGLSIWLVLLTTFIMPISVLASWHVTKRVREFMIFMLVLETGMIGVFISLDMFLFYLFFEITLIPMYFLIGVWGGERRIYAALKFFIYTVVGSLLMLVAIIAVYYLNGGTTFDIVEITNTFASKRASIGIPVQRMLWFAFALAFFIKVPLWPLHTWLPDAHVEAPTAGSIILAGVLLKMGTYGLMRFNLPLFPEVSRESAPIVMTLAVIGIIYGALVAMVQPDMKKLVAYSSVSHLGFVVLGIFAFTEQGMQGALYQMLNHGISTGALFYCVGIVYERRHTRLIADYGGIATPMPQYSTLFVILSLSSLGLPLLNGFIGEFLILLGTFASTVPYAKLFAVLGATGVILSAVYLLWMLQRVVFGEITKDENAELEDLDAREYAGLVPLVVMAVIMGVVPMLFMNQTKATVNAIRAHVEGKIMRASK
ncbi:MAG: NADH-quinone oxidoreductase subunit M [Acidobacteria bacterium]|nr:NADH-quinone oxidoreductase subunit M [Acidobacteriota bacterium]MBI3425630.1 NADH-quinone oxidoreductase subunit M [Acidobacteriota bacterium]